MVNYQWNYPRPWWSGRWWTCVSRCQLNGGYHGRDCLLRLVGACSGGGGGV